MRQMLSEPGRVRRDALSIQLLIGEGLLAFIHVFSICVVATILFVAVDDLEPNRRYALAFKFLPRLCECCGNRMKTDALAAVRLGHNERALSAK